MRIVAVHGARTGSKEGLTWASVKLVDTQILPWAEGRGQSVGSMVVHIDRTESRRSQRRAGLTWACQIR